MDAEFEKVSNDEVGSLVEAFNAHEAKFSIGNQKGRATPYETS